MLEEEGDDHGIAPIGNTASSGTPQHWSAVRCGCIEGVLATAILAGQHADVWEAASMLLREHHRSASLLCTKCSMSADSASCMALRCTLLREESGSDSLLVLMLLSQARIFVLGRIPAHVIGVCTGSWHPAGSSHCSAL